MRIRLAGLFCAKMSDRFSRFLLVPTPTFGTTTSKVIIETFFFSFSFQAWRWLFRFLYSYFLADNQTETNRQKKKSWLVTHNTISVKYFVQHLAIQDEMCGEPERPRMLLDFEFFSCCGKRVAKAKMMYRSGSLVAIFLFPHRRLVLVIFA